MKKTALPLLLMASLGAPLAAQQVAEDNFQRLVLRYETPEVTTLWRPLLDREYPTLAVEGYQSGGRIGAPALPMQSQTIEVPFCERVVVEVSDAVYDTFDLPQQTLYPLQPSRSKSDTRPVKVRFDSAAYSADAYWGMPLAEVKELGVSRDRRLALVTYSPVQVNPVAGKMVVCRSATVTLRYVNAQAEASLAYYRRYHTPAFSHVKTLNNLFTSKDATANVPIRMVVVLGAINNVSSCHSLQRFVEWKRKQGMLVDVIDASQSWTAQSVADSLVLMYSHGSEELPAPTFVVLVGDHQQLPAFYTKLGSSNAIIQDQYPSNHEHYTDHYFSTLTSDNLPDVYVGRFSASDTSTLAAIVSKTLLYEQYAFSDDAYLGSAALVSGVDGGEVGDAAYTYSDPTMDYLARYYFNSDNGYNQVYYYKNNINFAPAGVTVTGSSNASSAGAILRARYNEGMGFINYSAHGFSTSWYKPDFGKTNANNMTNNGKPSVVIANCCLSNQFYNTTCLGEAMVRRANNAGAVTYTGGVNLTYWEQDFHWAVGVRSSIYNTMNTSYSASRLGAFDRLFHTHNESPANRASTIGAMTNAGLMAVNSTSGHGGWYGDMVDYYWEVYELLGDPSLMPWLGTASDMPFTARQQGGACIRVATAPYAYVAVVDSSTMLPIAAAFADNNGSLCLNIDLATCPPAFYTVTAAGYKPLQRSVEGTTLGIGANANQGVSLSPNPATDRVAVSAPNLRQVDIIDVAGRTLVSRKVKEDTVEIDMSHIPAGVYLVRLHTANTVEVKKLIVNNK